MMERRHYLLLCVIITVTFSLVDCWKLRDLSQKSDENKLQKKPIFRDLPMKKILKVERIKVSDESDQNSEDDGVVTNEEEDNDDFTFEKVHTTNFDLPLKPVITLNNPDVEQEEEERLEEADETKKVESWLSHLPRINLFSDKEVDGNSIKPEVEESGGIFSWFTKKNNESTGSSTDDDIEETDANNWFSFLKSINLKYFTEFLVPDDDSKSGDESKRRNKKDELISEKREPLSTQIFENLLLTIPSFIPNYTKIDDVDCRRMGQIFQRQVRGQKLWALQMMDASAKISSGLLRGNANQLGDYDLCTGIRTKVKIKDDKSVKIKGKYCLANIDLAAEDEQLKMSIHLVQGRNFLRSRLEDPSHFLPRFSTLKWALCIPNGCSNENALQILNDFLVPFNATGVKIFTEIDENSCYVKSQKNWSNILKENWQVAATVAYMIFFVVVAVIASLNDYWKILKLDILFAPDKKKVASNDKTIEPSDSSPESVIQNDTINENERDFKGATRILMAFSIKRTGRALFNFKEENGNNTFRCIDGLKGLCTVPLFLSLKLLTFGHLPFTNKAQLTKILNSSLSVFLRTSFLYMDVFLLASGFFAGYKFSEDIKNHNRISWFRRITARFLRLFPSLSAAIFFTAWILPYIGSGPQWGPLIEHNSNLCQTNFWKNIFFLQNFSPAQEQCSPHLQQIAIEFQLFIVAPIIVYFIENNALIGVGLFGAINAFSAAMRYSTALSERLSFVIFQGMKLSQFYRTVDLSFNSTLQRSTSYLIGLGLGVLLFNLNKRDIKLSKGIFALGWLSCIWSIIWCFWTPSNLSNSDYVYEPLDAAVYAAWAPLVWSLALSWIIFVVFIENGGILTRILTAPPFVLLSRISYQMFFVQFITLFYITATVRNGETFGLWSFVNYIEIFSIIGISIISTLLFDLPLQEISKMITTYEDVIIEREESIKEDLEEPLDNEKNPDHEIDEIWANNESSHESRSKVSFADNDIVEDEIYSKRSYTPIWKKSDDEKPMWGDDDEVGGEREEENEEKYTDERSPSIPESEPEYEENNSEDEDISSENE